MFWLLLVRLFNVCYLESVGMLGFVLVLRFQKRYMTTPAKAVSRMNPSGNSGTATVVVTVPSVTVWGMVKVTFLSNRYPTSMVSRGLSHVVVGAYVTLNFMVRSDPVPVPPALSPVIVWLAYTRPCVAL